MYLLLVSAAAAWWLLPGLRLWVRARMARGAAAVRLVHLPAARPARNWRMTAPDTRALLAAVRAQGRWWLLALAVLAAVPAGTLVLRHWNAYDGFDHTVSREINPQVARLLEGEQLVPPAPLPPELFLTREVERARPSTAGASRRWELLDDAFRNRLLAVFRLMREEHGLEMVLLEGYRSGERQAELARLGPTVTHAGAGESYHQYGLAADCAFLVNGRVVISEQDPAIARAYERYGAVAQSAGLVWGGGWRTLKDLGHVELRRPGVLKKDAATPVSLQTDKSKGES